MAECSNREGVVTFETRYEGRTVRLCPIHAEQYRDRLASVSHGARTTSCDAHTLDGVTS